MTRRWATLVAVAVLVAFSVPISAQLETVDELRTKAKQGDAVALNRLDVLTWE